MSFSFGLIYGSTNNLQTHVFGTCWNTWKKNCNDSNATWSSPKRLGNTRQTNLKNNPSWVTSVHILHLLIHFLPPWLQPRCTRSVGINFIHLGPGRSRWWSDHAVTNPGVVKLPRIEFRTSWRALRFSKIGVIQIHQRGVIFTSQLQILKVSLKSLEPYKTL